MNEYLSMYVSRSTFCQGRFRGGPIWFGLVWCIQDMDGADFGEYGILWH